MNDIHIFWRWKRMCTPDWLESRGPGPSALALAAATRDEAAFGALLAQPFGSGPPQYVQQVKVCAPRGEVHGPAWEGGSLALHVKLTSALALT